MAETKSALPAFSGKNPRGNARFRTIELLRVKRENEGESAFGLSATDRSDAETGLGLLRPHNFTLRQAAEFLIANIDIVESAKPVSEVVTERGHPPK